MAQNVGKIFFSVGGALIESLEGASLALGGRGATPEDTDQDVTHYVEVYKHSMVKCTIPINQDTPLEDLRNLRMQAAIFECDNGIKYNLTSMCSHNANDWEIKKGGLAAEFFANGSKNAT